MKRSISKLGTVAGLLLVGAACGTETGNPEALEVQYNARSSAPELVAVGDGDAAVVDEVWLRLAAVDLGGCTADVAASTSALGWSDHSGADAVTEIVEVPDSTFCDLSTTFFVDPQAFGEPPEWQGASFALSGTLADGRAFRVVHYENAKIEVALDEQGLPDDAAWLIAFDVATWLDVEALEALPGDPVVVDEFENVAVLNSVVGRLSEGVQVFLDADRDGRVDPGEVELSQ